MDVRSTHTLPTLVRSGHEADLAATLRQPALDGPAFARGASVGRYVILEPLGAGMMGVVYAAFDPELDRKVALKFLRADASDLEGRARLLREAQAMARLAHPNVVTVHDVGTLDERVFVAMEFVRGVTLRVWLAERPRGWRAIVDVFAAVGRGLAAAHEAGLIHRDLKPDNIMLGADGRVRVMDFGLARASAEADRGPTDGRALPTYEAFADELTRTGTLVGTPAYMAPEQWEGTTDARTDQFAYCVALWEALHGERPFRGATLPALMLAITRGEVAPPADPRRSPAWLQRLLLRGLSVTPGARWPSMAALVAELARDRPAAWRRGALGLAGVALVVLGGLGVVQVRAQREAAAAERARAEEAEAAGAAARQQAERAALERAAVADAARHAEVLRLAVTPGRERDALVLGLEILAPFGPTFTAAPPAVLDGVARALPALIPSRTFTSPAEVEQVAFSPDDSILATLSKGQIGLWSTATGEPLRTIAADGSLGDFSFSPDGARIVARGEPCGVWDVASGRPVAALERCRNPRFSSDGSLVFGLVERLDTTGVTSPWADPQLDALAAWDATTGARLWSLPILGRRDVRVFTRPGDDLVLVSSDARALRVEFVDVRTGARRSHLERRRGEGRLHAALSPSGRTLATATDRERHLELWELDARAVDSIDLGLADARRTIDALEFSGDEAHLVARVGEAVHAVVDLERRALVYLGAGGEAVPGARHFVTSDWMQGQFTLWDRPEGRPIAVGKLPGRIGRPAHASGGETLAVPSGATTGLWSLTDPVAAQRWSPPAGEAIQQFGGGLVSTRDARGTWRLHDPARGQIRATLQDAPAARDTDESWRAGSGVWITTRADRDDVGRLRYVDATTGEVKVDRSANAWPAANVPRFLQFEDEGPSFVDASGPQPRRCDLGTYEPSARGAWPALRADGGLFARLHRSGRVDLWDPVACAPLGSFVVPAPSTPEYAFERAFSVFYFLGPNHLLVYEGEQHGRTDAVIPGRPLVIDARSGALKLQIDERCPHMPWQFRGSPDGDVLLAWCAGDDRGVVWHVDSGAKITELDSPIGFMAVFSPDGARMALSTRDGGYRIVDTLDGREELHLRPRRPVAWHRRVAFTEDGEHLSLVGDDGALYTYPATRPGLLARACRVLADTDARAAVAGACASILAAASPRGGPSGR